MANDTRPGAIRVPNTYMDIEVTEYSGAVVRYDDVSWSVEKVSERLYLYNRQNQLAVEYNNEGWLKVVVL